MAEHVGSNDVVLVLGCEFGALRHLVVVLFFGLLAASALLLIVWSSQTFYRALNNDFEEVEAVGAVFFSGDPSARGYRVLKGIISVFNVLIGIFVLAYLVFRLCF